jgi:hypothetical protein
VRSLLGLNEEMNLMAVIAPGHPASGKHASNRKDLAVLLLKEV